MATKEEVIAAIKGFSESEKTEVKEALGISKDSSKSASTQAPDLTGKIEDRIAYNKLIRETADLLGNAAESAKAEYEGMLLMLEQQGVKREQIQQIIDGELTSYTDLKGNEIELNELQIKRLQTLAKIERGQKKYGKDQKKLLGDIASAIGLTMRLEESFLGTVMKVTKALAAQGKEGEDARAAFMKNLKSIFNLSNLALSALTAIMEVTIATVVQFDNARAKLAGLTGAGYEFSDAMFDAQRQANLMGVTMDDAAGATGALFNNTTNFVNISKEAQAELITTTAMMGKLGIDSETAAKNFQFFNLVLGMTAEEANDAQVQLAMMGTELGISSAKITKDFQAALPTLAVYGRESVEVFQGLAAAAKAAGVETSALLGISKKFDTFAGAAEGAAKLNALLGTQLSTTQLLMMTEDERIETLIASVQAQGVAFGDMDKFTQMAIANAAGITDMNEANRIFGMDLGQYDEYKDKMEANSESQKKFEDAVAKTVPVFNQFKLLATEFIVAVEPLLEFLTDVASGMTEWLGSLTQGEKEFLSFSIAFVAGGLLLIKMITAIAGAFTRATPAAPAFGASVAAAVTAIGASVTGVITTVSAAVAGTAGIGGILLAGIFGGTLVIVAAVVAMASAMESVATAYADIAKSEVDLVKTQVELASSSGDVLDNLSTISSTSFAPAIDGMTQLLKMTKEFGKMAPEASATIENLALLSAGRAKDSMTNKVVQASTTNIQNNVQNIFKGMEMVVNIKDVGPLKGYVEKVSQKTTLGR